MTVERAVPSVHVPALISLLFIVLIVYWVVKARPEIIAAMIVSLGYSGRSFILFSPVALLGNDIVITSHTYILAVALLCATAILIRRSDSQSKSVYYSHRWVFGLLMIWWTLQISFLVIQRNYGNIFVNIVINIILVNISVIIFSRDIERIQTFARSYIFTTVFTAIFAIYSVLNFGGHTLSYLLEDPALSQATPWGFGWYLPYGNYHYFASGMEAAAILSLILFRTSHSQKTRLFYLLITIFCIYSVAISQSRQHMISLFLVLPMIVYWGTRKQTSRDFNAERLAVFAGLIIVLIFFIRFLANNPSVYTRYGQEDISVNQLAESSLAIRQSYWSRGIEIFLQSPLWGTAFGEYNTHNIFLSAAVDQGIAGLIFFIVWLYFCIKVTTDAYGTPVKNYRMSVWQQGLLFVALAAYISGMASGALHSKWHIYWPVFMSWQLSNSKTFARNTLLSTFQHPTQAEVDSA